MMHPYTDSSDRLKVYIYIAIACIVITPKLNTFFLSIERLKDLEPWVSASVSFTLVYTVVYQFFKKYLWKFGIVRKIGFLKTSNLNGVYTGHLISSYKVNKENVRVTLKLNIQQDWTSIQVAMETGNNSSTSQSVMANMCEINDSLTRLIYYYTNTPLNQVADDDMFQHDGTANLVFKNNGTVTGNYFNGKLRKGSIRLTKM